MNADVFVARSVGELKATSLSQVKLFLKYYKIAYQRIRPMRFCYESNIKCFIVSYRLHDSVEISSVHSVITGDNSETNKRRKLEEVIGQIFLSYVNDRVDFYQKFENPVIRELIVDEFWMDYRKSIVM